MMQAVLLNKGRIHQCAMNTDVEYPATLQASLKP